MAATRTPRLDHGITRGGLEAVEQPPNRGALAQVGRWFDGHHAHQAPACEIGHDREVTGGVADSEQPFELPGVAEVADHIVQVLIRVTGLGGRHDLLHVAIDRPAELHCNVSDDLTPTTTDVNNRRVPAAESRCTSCLEDAGPVGAHVAEGHHLGIGIAKVRDEIGQHSGLLDIADLLVDDRAEDTAPRPVLHFHLGPRPTQVGPFGIVANGDQRSHARPARGIAQLLHRGGGEPFVTDPHHERNLCGRPSPGGRQRGISNRGPSATAHRFVEGCVHRGSVVDLHTDRTHQPGGQARHQGRGGHQGLGGPVASISLGFDACGGEQSCGARCSHG